MKKDVGIRRLVRRDLGGDVTWLIEPNSVPPFTMIRRYHPSGLIQWYTLSNRDATPYDLVDPHSSIAFEVGIFVGLVDGLLPSSSVDEGLTWETQPASPMIVLRSKSEKQLIAMKWNDVICKLEDEWSLVAESNPQWRVRWRYLRDTQVGCRLPVPHLRAESFHYSAAFKKSLPQEVPRTMRKCRAPDFLKAAMNLVSLAPALDGVIESAYRAAFEVGRHTGRFLWQDHAIINTLQESHDGHCHGVHKLVNHPPSADKLGWSQDLVRQINSALAFLGEVRPRDYLTFTESLAKVDGFAWDGAKPSLPSGPLFSPAWKDESLRETVKRTGKRHGLDPSVAELIREFVAKYPQVRGRKQYPKFIAAFPSLKEVVSESKLNHLVYPRVNEAGPKSGSTASVEKAKKPPIKKKLPRKTRP